MKVKICVLIMQLVFQLCYSTLYEDDDCELDENTIGKCVRLSLCPSAIKLIQNYQHPPLCSFIRFTPIICCPVAELIKIRLSEKKCLNYQNLYQIGERDENNTTESTVTKPYPPVITQNVTINNNNSLSLSDIFQNLTDIYSNNTNVTIHIKINYTEDTNKKIQEPLNVTILSINTNDFENETSTEYTLTTTEIINKLPELSIIRGTGADYGEFPHMAALGFSNGNEKSWQCGGSLISDKYVLTAAHCLNSVEYGSLEWVHLGHNILNLGSEFDEYIYKIKRRISHPSYKRPSVYHDIALLELDRTVIYSDTIKPACLHTIDELDPNVKLIATGWGLTENGSTSNLLQKATLDLFTPDECDKTYENIQGSRKLKNGIIHKTQFCAAGRNLYEDTCQGDSGGPLQIKLSKENIYSIVGITSFGKQCGFKSVPGVYIRVAPYVSWIESIIWPND